MLTTITAIAGLVFGVTGLILGTLNFYRDRSKISVRLDWDSILGSDSAGRDILLGRIRVSNHGRRPVFLTAIGLKLDTHKSRLVVRRQVTCDGRKLNEGDPSIDIAVPDDDDTMDALINEAVFWREIRAYATDSTGKTYLAPKVSHRPWWGEGNGKLLRGQKGGPWYIEFDFSDAAQQIVGRERRERVPQLDSSGNA
jgi:hypothetical protein